MMESIRFPDMGHWYYGENGQQVGPVDEGSIRAGIHQGRVSLQTLVWREGMPDWLPLSQVPELSGQTVVPTGHPASPYTPPGAPYQPYAQNFAPTSGNAIASMVCGIMGLVTCLIILGIPAVICGHLALKQINESALPMGGRGMALSGLIMGYIQIISCVVGIVLVIFAFASQ
jgi:hypothetical protein